MDSEHCTALISELRLAIINGDSRETERLALRSIEQGVDPSIALEAGLSKGIKAVGDSFGKGDIFLPELIMAAEALKIGTTILNEELQKRGKEISALGTFVIGTAKGDIHDIGKTMVATLLTSSGFRVIDLGTDVSKDKFVESIREHKADIVGISSLLTTTMQAQEATITALKEAGIRARVKVMVGGAPVTEQWAEQIGADAYGVSAADAVEKAKNIMQIIA